MKATQKHIIIRRILATPAALFGLSTHIRTAVLAAVFALVGALGFAAPANAIAVDHGDCFTADDGSFSPYNAARTCLTVWVTKDNDGAGGTINTVSILASDSGLWKGTAVNGRSVECWTADNVIRWQKTDGDASPYSNVNLGDGDNKRWNPDLHLGSATRITCAYRGTTHTGTAFNDHYKDFVVKVAFDVS